MILKESVGSFHGPTNSSQTGEQKLSSFLYFNLAKVTIHMAKWICNDKRGNGFTCMVGPLIQPFCSGRVEKGVKTTLRGRTHQDSVYFSYKFINYHAPEKPKIITCHAIGGCGTESLQERTLLSILFRLWALLSGAQSRPEPGHLERGWALNRGWWGIVH